MKLKAGLSSILDKDEELMANAKKNYFNHILIASDDENEQSPFMKFINTDYREELITLK